MSTEDLIRELEAGGVLKGSPSAPPQASGGKGVQTRRAVRGSGILFLIIAAILIAVVGSVPFGSTLLYPFALFVTLLHETGHALATVASGGSVRGIELSSNLSGFTLVAGGSQALIAPAGYLGATLAGVALLLAPLRFARQALVILAAVPLVALLLFHPVSSFTALWCAVFCVALGIAAWALPLRFAAFLQVFLGVEAGLNAFRDLMTLLFISGTDSHIHSDALNMSNALFLPPLFWAITWTVLSVALLGAALLRLVRRDWPRLRG